MFVGSRSHAQYLPLLAAAAGFVAMAPGCSSSAPATPQAGIVWVVEPGANSSALCPVGGEDTWTIGGGGTSDTTVADNGSSNGVPVSVQCSVSGNDSSGYNLFLTADYGTNEGALTITGHVDGTTNAQLNITGTFDDNLPSGMTANLVEGPSDDGGVNTGCTITYPRTGNGMMGVAPGRIWAHIDCPTATDATRARVCDANADFRFENCNQ
jgi:hypothetical protein